MRNTFGGNQSKWQGEISDTLDILLGFQIIKSFIISHSHNYSLKVTESLLDFTHTSYNKFISGGK